MKHILGIETSCDDTGIALIKGNEIIENIVLKQEHKSGVIPEYAAREHHIALSLEVEKIIKKHQKPDLIAYTQGPGLIGSLFVGACFAKGFAYSAKIPSIGVNHLEAHIILPHYIENVPFPYLCLLISGGHTMIVLVKEIGCYEIFSQSLDDAVGEVFDKVARNIGLAYPGGPEIEKEAKKALNLNFFEFPRAMENNDDFSFSGLKTAAIRQINKEATPQKKADFCYAFQNHVAEMLADKMERINSKIGGIPSWVASGGVAANQAIKGKLNQKALKNNANFFIPPPQLCTDNGLMIAVLGKFRFEKFGKTDLSLRPSAQSRLI